LFGGAVGFEGVENCDLLASYVDRLRNSTFEKNIAIYGFDYGSKIVKQDAKPFDFGILSGLVHTNYLLQIVFRDGFGQITEGLRNCKLRFRYFMNSPLRSDWTPYPKLYSNGALLSITLSNPAIISMPFVFPKFNLSASNLNPKAKFSANIRFDSSDWLIGKESFTEVNISMQLCDIDEILVQAGSGNVRCDKCPQGRVPNMTVCISCPEGKSSVLDKCIPCLFGRFSTVQGSPLCSPCSPGSYNNFLGSSSCFSCPLGFFVDFENASSCLTCFEGSTTRFEGSANASACLCPQGYYGSKNCSKCGIGMKGISCPLGSILPLVEEGFFRMPGDDPNEVRQCVVPSACKYTGTQLYTPCSEGFTGIACGSCLKDFFWSDWGCKSCKKYSEILVVLLLFLALVLLLSYRIAATRSLKSSPADVKVLLAGIQWIASLAKVSKKWPPFLSSFMSGVAIFNFDINATSPSCIFGSSFWGFYYFSLILPFLFCAIISLFAWLMNKLAKPIISSTVLEKVFGAGRGKRPDLLSKSIAAFLFFMSLMYTFIILNAFRPFQCLEQSDGTFTMISYPSLQCFDVQWYSNLGFIIVLILITVIAYPCGVCWILYSNRRNIHSDQFLNRYGYLIDPYKPDFFWWEIYVLVKKTLFSILLSSLITFPDSERSFYLTIYLLFCLIIENICKPYKYEELNSINTIWNLLSLIWLIALAVLFLQEFESSSHVAIFSYLLVAIFSLIALFCIWGILSRKMSDLADMKRAEQIHENFKAPEATSNIANHFKQDSSKESELNKMRYLRKELDSNAIFAKSTI
jgi:hypothetical protein